MLDTRHFQGILEPVVVEVEVTVEVVEVLVRVEVEEVVVVVVVVSFPAKIIKSIHLLSP